MSLTTIARLGAMAWYATGQCKKNSSINVSETRNNYSVQQETVIEDLTYKATISDRDEDGKNDCLKLERKIAPSYGSREPMVEYFVTSLPRSPEQQSGVVVNIVRPDFFEQYERLFDPNRDLVTKTYK